MGTRINIGIVNLNDSITAIYCHWDGFPEWNGMILLQQYTSTDIVNQLMLLCHLYSLNEKLYPDDSKPHTFQNAQDDVCVAYGRERSESDVDCTTFINIDEFEKYAVGTDAEYQYLFTNGKWTYREANRGGKWKELTAEDCKE